MTASGENFTVKHDYRKWSKKRPGRLWNVCGVREGKWGGGGVLNRYEAFIREEHLFQVNCSN